ncbi:MAG: leucine-rich repeat domain-containing protein [Butyribacter sp.]|nr:leucine-rich repeat domain-containing protein [bacterium]MDY3855434.1 leucine-rich repeat domain-containing protein [Butyribacter sp.]
MENQYQYERLQDNTIRLLRVFGSSPEVVIPETICGMAVSEIGAYCFAQTNKTGNCEESGDASLRMQLCNEGKIRELAGDYLQKVTLPDSIVSLGNLAFYQCRHLSELTIGRQLVQIGSDAFMNCRKLTSITIRGSVTQSSGLKQILAQRNAETSVHFCPKRETEAVLIYPEYSESYDEIGPAHIFTLNIEGDGFRARQCFQDGIVSLSQYDQVFEQAVLRENEETLCRMAAMRLYYPTGLSQERKESYEKYLTEHAAVIGKRYIKEKEKRYLSFLIQYGYLADADLAECMQYAVTQGWAEGVREILQWQKQTLENQTEDAYGFDDFS